MVFGGFRARDIQYFCIVFIVFAFVSAENKRLEHDIRRTSNLQAGKMYSMLVSVSVITGSDWAIFEHTRFHLTIDSSGSFERPGFRNEAAAAGSSRQRQKDNLRQSRQIRRSASKGQFSKGFL